MPLVRLCEAARIRPGEMAEFSAEGLPVLVCHTDDGFYAMHAVCPHRNGPLAHGALHGHSVVCPWHAWEFDCRTGTLDFNPDVRIETYPLSVEQGEILVELPDSSL
jgi:nitrite reductase/ring-hydroxylating ferredoxin subunit